jgi:hypothetical protein
MKECLLLMQAQIQWKVKKQDIEFKNTKGTLLDNMK